MLPAAAKTGEQSTRFVDFAIHEMARRLDALGALRTEVEVKLSRLDGEIAALHANAQRDAADEQLRMAAAMEAEKQRILTASEQEIATATALAQRQLKQFAAGLAIDQAAQKLVISADTERLMIEQFAAGLSDDQGRGGLN